MDKQGYVYMLASARYGTLVHKTNPLWRDLFDEIVG